MVLLSFLLLIVPGLICQWINGYYRMDTWKELISTVMMAMINNFIIAVSIAMLFSILYDGAVYSFSSKYNLDSSLTIFHVAFVSKYALLALFAAVGLGIFEKIILIFYKKIKYKGKERNN